MAQPEIFDVVATVLHTQFKVDRSLIRPEAPLTSFGLDSLGLMEFVFAVEDRFALRIPEERLDPRQAELTLADVCRAITDHLAPQGQASLAS